MEKLMILFSRKTLPVLVGAVLTIITLGSTGLSIIKASQSITSNIKTDVPEVKTVKEVNSENKIESNETVTPKDAGTKNVQLNAKSAVGINSTNLSKTPAAGATNLAASSGNILSAQTTADNRCLIVLFGKQYDVTALRSSHPGGDVFNCGTDMSATYQKAHGTDLSRMQQYLVSGSSAATGTGAGSSSTSTNVSTGGGNQSQTYHDDDGKEFEESDEIEKKEEDQNIEEGKEDLRTFLDWGTTSSAGGLA